MTSEPLGVDPVADRRALPRASGCPGPDGPSSSPAGTPGAVRIAARCTTAPARSSPTRMIETWQADPDGRFDHPDDPRGPPRSGRSAGFRGFARASTDDGGCVRDRHGQAGAAARSATARRRRRTWTSRCSPAGMLDRIVTRLYFPDEQEANAADPVLSGVDRRAPAHAAWREPEATTATASTSTSRATHETVFFAL